ncbi:MAG: hypothetical protein NTZ90_11175 [Proteobacteria bacterium]|nr:hypothetical protein [Pseudomonadota bacterium]
MRRFLSIKAAAARPRGIAAGGRGRDGERGVELEVEVELEGEVELEVEAELKVALESELVVAVELEGATVDTARFSDLSELFIRRSLRTM